MQSLGESIIFQCTANSKILGQGGVRNNNSFIFCYYENFMKTTFKAEQVALHKHKIFKPFP